ncbi:MAG: restriction endonuclease subunit S [Elusimicrobia bacterium]|nr:restriction endonuclease subunit S [Elusimicrobiota bacterium]
MAVTQQRRDSWKRMTLGEFVALQRGHDLPEQMRKPGSIPILGSFGITGWHSNAKARGPGVIIGRSGASFGVVSYSPGDYWPLNTALYVVDFHGNDERFAYYFLKSLDFKRYNSGSAQPSLNRNFIHPMEVVIPPVNEQKTIAHILGTLDDKIELNRRMNETLEAMARAIFKSWFVDFDPVKAKAAGRRPAGMDAATAALFPDSFEDSELGEIPKGWRVGAFGDVAEHPRRSVQPDQIGPGTPYIALEHMPRRCIALSDWSVAVDLESNKFEFKTGEILFGKLRPYFHKVGVAPLDGVCSTDILVVVPRADDWFGFVLCQASSESFVEYANAGSTGTKMPRTSWDEMARYPLGIPPKPVAEAFTKQVRPAFDGIIARIHESHTLAALRDTLLPKLLSGEIRVADAGKMAEAAA